MAYEDDSLRASAYMDGWADAAALKRRNPPADPAEAVRYNAGYSAALADDDRM